MSLEDITLKSKLDDVGVVGDIYTMNVLSAHRIVERSVDQADFHYDPYPKHVFVQAMHLLHVSIPFPLMNVTETYGDSISMRITYAGTPYDFTITLQHAYYTIMQLVEFINTAIAYETAVQSIPVVVSLSSSWKNNFLQVNTADPAAIVTFYPSSKPYVNVMLGVYTDVPTDVTFTGFFSELPLAFTDQLPFRSIYIHVDPLPPSVFTSRQSNAHFIISTDSYRPRITTPTGEVLADSFVRFNSESNYIQRVIFFSTLQKLPILNIRLTDEEGNSLSEHTGGQEWSMTISVVGINNYANRSSGNFATPRKRTMKF